ncbi:hypothetical protein KM1_231020 [Entamoeba histolytica HM-3:IMSS]|uniref:Chitinase n=2 Tax=Entamoeba histolytica TaxID=5759 RepID=M2S304_ENTHI|nr:Hypothetical protein EHI5A_152790 [Entamoeba histolytica KU27]EMS16018.1 hypothetical protein KM1_231020 [Entamoeba histolytica HM-3:IMSS]
MRKTIPVVIWVLILLIENCVAAVITDFNSIEKQPRKFKGKIFAIIESDEDMNIAIEHKDRIDQVIGKGFSAESFPSGSPKIEGEWVYKKNFTHNIGHIMFGNFASIVNWTFEMTEAVIETINKYGLDGVCMEDLENVYFITGRSTRDVRLILRRLGIELHKIQKQVFAIIPPNSQAIGISEITSLKNLVDEFILDDIQYYDRNMIGSHCTSPVYYIKGLVEQYTSNYVDLTKKTSITIDLSGTMLCPNQPRSMVNSTYFYNNLLQVKKSEWIDKCQEQKFIMENGCEIMYPTIEFIQKRIDLATELGVDITLYNINAVHPNTFNLF